MDELNLRSADYYLSNPASTYLERQSARIEPVDILKHLVAFANSNGGSLVIGVEDDGAVSGFAPQDSKTVDDYKAISAQLRETPIECNFHEIPIVNNKGQDDFILVILVEMSSKCVIKSHDRNVYMRYGDKTEKIDHERILQLEYDRGERFFENLEVEGSSIEDIDLDLLNEYKEILKTDQSIEDILRARRLLVNGQLTNAGLILFGKYPSGFLPQARVKFVRYEGTEPGVGKTIGIIKERTFDSALPKLIREMEAFVETQMRDFQFLDENGIFSIMPEYPPFAWLEGIVNAVTHRNYSIRGDYTKFFMFDDRIEIKSPGNLPNIVTVENIKENRFSRNPIIARVLSDFGMVRELNEGVKRIYQVMHEILLHDPKFIDKNGNVTLSLKNNILDRHIGIDENLRKKFSSKTYDDLNSFEKTILKIAFARAELTVSEVARLTGRHRMTARKALQNLLDQGFLYWHGINANDPTQYYSLI